MFDKIRAPVSFIHSFNVKVILKFFFLKMGANPGLFFVYFQSFQTNNTIFSTNQCEKMSKCPSSKLI